MKAPAIPYIDQKEEIRSAIEQCARAGRTIHYSELGRLLDISERGPWKPILDLIPSAHQRKLAEAEIARVLKHYS
jgi:hypothetical protein